MVACRATKMTVAHVPNEPIAVQVAGSTNALPNVGLIVRRAELTWPTDTAHARLLVRDPLVLAHVTRMSRWLQRSCPSNSRRCWTARKPTDGLTWKCWGQPWGERGPTGRRSTSWSG